MPKTLDTLVEDVYQLFDPNKGHEPSEENLETFAQNIKETLRLRLAQRENVRDPLRFSSLGKTDRQIWHMAHGTEQEELSSKTFFKFLYGDVIEQLVLFLVKEAGHTVEREQEEVEVDGVKGHIDAIVDGVVVDVKSASPFSFKKFKDQTVFEDDPFGYIPQISGYANVLTPGESSAFLAFDKVHGDLCVMHVPASISQHYRPEDRIAHLKDVISSPVPPNLCHADVKDGESGNRKLGTECSYCPFKRSCFPDLRTFIYSSGPRYLTRVERVPNVPEVT